jgi:hypothetical protein
MALPVQKPKRRWVGILAWVLLAFAGGIALGPPLGDYADVAVNGTAAFLGKHAPWLLGKYRPAPDYVTPPPMHRGPRISPPAPPVAPVVAQPVAPPAAAEPQPASTAGPEPEPASPSAAERAEPARPAAHRGRSRGAARAPTVAAAAPAKKGSRSHDPFEDSSGGAASPPPAASKHESASKPAARSSDALDNLMADVVTENKGKGKRSASKDIDAMLKGVQKGSPPPASKPAAPAELPPLSPSDISRVMGKVKTRANACGKQFGDKGTAELTVTVGKSGKVSNVAVGGKVGGTKTGACVEKAVRAAVFPPNSGLRFDYRIDVR